ncbi:MAG: hypothetical protein ACRYG5_15225 [Janthinobacterium lividum]
MAITEFNALQHCREYQYDYVTVLEELIPENICAALRQRVNELISKEQIKLVNHKGLGTYEVSDQGGQYLHHIFQGPDVRTHLPELCAIYHSILPLIGCVTNLDVVVSPHARSDINIKVYPKGGGTLGEHYDSNGITVLLFLTTNKEAPLRMQIPRSHPSKKLPCIERKNIYAKSGALLIMKGREVLHDCEPTVTEQKITVVFNYYARHDTWRHEKFDAFVYDGAKP